VFHGFNDLRVLKGVILDDAAPRRISVRASKARPAGQGYVVAAELLGESPRGDAPILHARAEILLLERLPVAPPNAARVLSSHGPYRRRPDEIYSDILFHGEDLRGITSVERLSAEGVDASIVAAPPPAAWMRDPPRSSWIADPLILDSTFQLMVVWGFEQFGLLSLPCRVGEYRQYQRRFPSGGVRAVISGSKNGANLARGGADLIDSNGALVARLAGYEGVMDPSLARAFRKNTLGLVAV
jgi:hypothetical protein